MNRVHLSQGGDIFAQRSNKQLQFANQAQKKSAKSGIFLKTTGVISCMVVMVFAINGVVVAGQAVFKPQTANTITDQTTPPSTPGIMQFLPQAQTPAVNQVMLAQNNTQISNHEAPPGAPPPDLGTIVNQINQANAAIASNMQACVQLTQQANAQIASMRATEIQMKDAITAISRQIADLDSHDPNREAKRTQLKLQRDQISTQRSELNRAISQTKSQFSRSRSECQNSVRRLQNAKRNLEVQLNNGFTRSLRITAR